MDIVVARVASTNKKEIIFVTSGRVAPLYRREQRSGRGAGLLA